MRRTGMRTLGAAALAALLSLTGCGSQDAASSDADGYHGCTAKEVRSHGTTVAAADLDGDGTKEDVRLVDSGGCADSLVAVQKDALAGLGVKSLDLLEERATVVHLSGSDSDLLLMKAHARGGLQPHLFSRRGNELRELTTDEGPLLPSVATGGATSPLEAACRPDGGVAVVTGTAHEPPGVVLAWDVTETTYDVRDGRAVRTGTSTAEEAAADPTLRKAMPELFDGRLFRGCS